MTSTKTLREILVHLSEGCRNIGANPGAWMMYEFIARVGVEYKSQPLTGYRRGPMKQCFSNTAQLVRKHRTLTYCEGYVGSNELPFPIHHAWAVDHLGGVVDVTLEQPQNHAYVGVPVANISDLRSRGSVSVLLKVNETVDAAYMLERCPSLIELMPELR